MAELTALKDIGRKSANVIMHVGGAEPEEILIDLHIIRVVNHIGITNASHGLKVEKDLMEIFPRKI